VKPFRCAAWNPGDSPDAAFATTYAGAAGLGPDAATLPPGHKAAGVFGYDRRTALADIADGTSNTLWIWETARDVGPWARGGSGTVRGLDPADPPHAGTGRPFGGLHFSDRALFGRGESLGLNVAMADGSVRYLGKSASAALFEAMVTIAGGEALPGE
jgi:prepilin-type processing-associated H-X9-DG protein